MSKYTNELHDRVRQKLQMIAYPRFDDGDIDTLLDEIERLQARIAELESAWLIDETIQKDGSLRPSISDTIHRYETRIAELETENSRLASRLHDVMEQLEIATDLGNKRWIALNDIYKNGEKHNANWCKRLAQEGLSIK